MPHDAPALPAELRLTLDPAPSAETRGQLGSAINAFNARSVPLDSKRFALLLHDEAGQLVAGLSASMSWTWLFVDGLWVADAQRGQGIGSALLARAEAHARAHGCHAVWLDTFQARGFYEKLGYVAFAELENYPRGQSRTFLRKELRDTTSKERIE